MKLIHTSDWHFGMGVGTGNYEQEQRFFLQQLYDLIQKEQVEAVLLSGDVFDSSVTNAQAIELYNEAVTTLCQKLGVKLIVIAGNHDSAARLASCRALLKGAGMNVTGRLERDVEPVLLDGGKVAVYSLPFFSRDEAAVLFPEKREQLRSAEMAMMVVCDAIRESMDPERKNIVLSHSLIVNAELSESDRSARVGFATAVSKEVFQEFDYVALGHIHKPQVISGHIRYSGSPLKYSFGNEESQEKGVVLLDTDTMEQRFVPLKPLRDRKTLEGTYEELIAREDVRDDYLRLYVTDRYAGMELLTDLRERFPYVLEVYGMGIAETDTLSALSVEQLQTLKEDDIMEKFMAENFGYNPTEEQQALFREVLAWSREEDDLG
jgi:exonuclease SbcD